jgi:hypothetical protein
MPATSWSKRKNAWVAAECAAIVAATSIGAHLFRAILDRIAYGNWGRDVVIRLGLSTIVVAIFWFFSYLFR